MYDFFVSLSGFLYDFLAVLGSHNFDIGGVNVSIVDILFGLLVMSIIISVFWKGAKG